MHITHLHIVSPSGAIAPQLITGAQQRLAAEGYSVTIAPHACSACGRFAGTEDERLGDLTEALMNPANDAILCARGGYGLQQLVDRLPQPVNGQRLPAVIGFSDITVLHQWCGLAGQPSLHALMCKHLAELPSDSEPLQLWHRALRGETLRYRIAPHPLDRSGSVRGRLIGGNLSVLYGLQGTPYSLTRLIDAQPDEPAILFLEDIGERHYHIDRMMQNLRLSGVMGRIAGLVIGRFSDTDDDPSMGCTVLQTVRRAAEGYSYPVLTGFPAGHVERNLPLWLNSPCTLVVGGGDSQVESRCGER